jgi:hypothetical protein
MSLRKVDLGVKRFPKPSLTADLPTSIPMLGETLAEPPAFPFSSYGLDRFEKPSFDRSPVC